jgi:cell division protein FtsI/penicillin-binding protein 2
MRRFDRLLIRLRPVAERLRPQAGAIGLIGVAAIILLWLGSYFADRLLDNRRWVADPPFGMESALDKLFFTRLRNAGLLWIEDRPGRARRVPWLRYASCENEIQPIPADLPALAAPIGGRPRPALDPTQLDALLPLLCSTPQGAEIRREIDQWNDSFELVAIRDDRAGNDARLAPKGGTPASSPSDAVLCSDQKTPVGIYVAPECLTTGWRAELVRGPAPIGAPPVNGAVPPYGDFAFIASDRHAWQSDWFVLPAPTPLRAVADDGTPLDRSRSPFYRLRTDDLPLGPEPVTIDLIGRPRRIMVDGKPYDINASLIEGKQSIALKPYAVELTLLCRTRKDCQSWPSDELSFAVALQIASPVAKTVAIEIDVDPIVADSGDLHHRTQHLDVVPCSDPDHLPTACQTAEQAGRLGKYALADWRTASTILRKSTDLGYRVVASDAQTNLVQPDTGIITDQALKLGLAPVVGLGPADVTSLTAVLGIMPHSIPETYRLTIDLPLQQQVAHAIDRASGCGDQVVPTHKHRTAEPCDVPGRQIAVVLMDASDNELSRGEILATASSPELEPGLSFWDLAALEAGAPSHSPIAGMAWRAVDIGATPGSTFKGVTALAAIDHVLKGNDGTLHDLLLGTMPLRDEASLLQLAAGDANSHQAPSCVEQIGGTLETLHLDYGPKDQASYLWLPVPDHDGLDLRCIGNAGEGNRESFSTAKVSPAETGCPASAEKRGIGLCEALITSSNLYFGGLALQVDGPAVMLHPGRGERIDDAPDLALAQMACRLSFGLSFCNQRGHGFDLMRGQLGLMRDQSGREVPRLVPRLVADPIAVEAARPPRLADGKPDPNAPRRLEVAEAGFGQSVQATALAMATIYAGIASDHVVRPRLVPRATDRAEQDRDPLEGARLLDLQPSQLPLYQQLLDEVRHGLAGVAGPHGTAQKAFLCSPLLTEKARNQGAAQDGENGRKCGPALPKWDNTVLYSKTGTAVLHPGAGPGGKDLSSGWLVGWVEPPASGSDRRIAFACVVTPTTEFGANACGPIIRAIFDSAAAAARNPPSSRGR